MDSVARLVDWFTSNGGTIDPTAIGFREFSDTGRGAVALRDLDVRGLLKGFCSGQHSESLHRVGGPHSVYNPTKTTLVDKNISSRKRTGRRVAVSWYWMGELDSVYDVGAI